METDWAENRAKIPQDVVRRTIGTLFDRLYDTGERDRFRTRVERVPAAARSTSATAASRSSIKAQQQGRHGLAGAPERSAARSRDAGAPDGEAGRQGRSRAHPGGQRAESRRRAHACCPAKAGAALEVDEGFDRAWRRVGLALDRSGFTVEDRDRTGGLYFVRYVDPKFASREEPGFFSKLFGLRQERRQPAALPHRSEARRREDAGGRAELAGRARERRDRPAHRHAAGRRAEVTPAQTPTARVGKQTSRPRAACLSTARRVTSSSQPRRPLRRPWRRHRRGRGSGVGSACGRRSRGVRSCRRCGAGVAAAGVVAGAGAAAGGAAGASVLPQAASATAANRDANRSDLFMRVLDRRDWKPFWLDGSHRQPSRLRGPGTSNDEARHRCPARDYIGADPRFSRVPAQSPATRLRSVASARQAVRVAPPERAVRSTGAACQRSRSSSSR